MFEASRVWRLALGASRHVFVRLIAASTGNGNPRGLRAARRLIFGSYRRFLPFPREILHLCELLIALDEEERLSVRKRRYESKVIS